MVARKVTESDDAHDDEFIVDFRDDEGTTIVAERSPVLLNAFNLAIIGMIGNTDILTAEVSKCCPCPCGELTMKFSLVRSPMDDNRITVTHCISV